MTDAATADQNLPQLLVDIVADPVCPWCFVGLYSFRQAQQTLAGEFNILPRYRAYQLNPGTPEEGIDRKEYYAKKFPDTDKRELMIRMMAKNAGEMGLEFDPMIPKILPNTLKAHQMIRLAHMDGLQEPVVDAIYDAFWREGVNIGDEVKLLEIVTGAGLDRAAAKAELENAANREELANEAIAFAQGGVSGVPTFIISERTGFSGAMAPDALADALRQAAELTANNA